MKKIIKLGLMSTMCASVALAAVGCGATSGDDFTTVTIDQIISDAKKLTPGSGSSSSSTEKKGDPNFTVPAAGFSKDTKVTIKFYHTMGQNLQDVLNPFITEFNKIYPNIKVEHSQVGGYDDVRNQISTELPVDNQPDLAYCYPDHIALYNLTGRVVKLDSLIDSTASDGANGQLGLTQAQKDDFIKGYYEEGRQFGDGYMYSLPFSKSTEVLYYNKSFFDKNNIPLPTHWFNESADDTTSLEAVMKKIKEIDPTSTPLGYDSESNWFINMCEQTGSGYTSADETNHFLFNNNKNKAIVNRFREWYSQGWVTTQKLYGSYTSGLFTTIGANENKSYMSIGSSAGATHQRPKKVDGKYPFEVGIASIPQMSTTNQRVISQGPSVCIFDHKTSDPNKVMASYLFLKYLTTSTAFQAAFGAASGYVPVLKSVSQNATYKALLDKADGYDNVAYLSAKVCMQQENYYYTSPAFNGSSKARDEVGTLISSILPHALTGATDEEKKAELISFVNGKFKDALYECEYAAQ
jgi:multiple sugar transport system substrate-binding protein